MTNDNEQVIEHLNEMAIEEENVLRDLNLEIEQQLMVNNSIIYEKKKVLALSFYSFK